MLSAMSAKLTRLFFFLAIALTGIQSGAVEAMQARTAMTKLCPHGIARSGTDMNLHMSAHATLHAASDMAAEHNTAPGKPDCMTPAGCAYLLQTGAASLAPETGIVLRLQHATAIIFPVSCDQVRPVGNAPLLRPPCLSIAA